MAYGKPKAGKMPKKVKVRKSSKMKMGKKKGPSNKKVSTRY